MSTEKDRPADDVSAEATAADAEGSRPSTLGAWGARTFSALTIANYRLFYVGQGLSLIGTWVRRTAMGWLVYKLTGSMSLLGWVMGLALVPLFLFSPAAGALADRVDKKKLIITTMVFSSLCSAAIALLIFTDTVRVWHLMVLALISGTAFAFEVPARQAYVVEMVGREHLRNAIALNSALVNGARIVGPALAGFIMQWVDMAACFALDALTYVLVIFTLVAINVKVRLFPHAKATHWELLKEGALEVWNNRPVRLVITLLIINGVFGWSFQTLMPAICQDVLHLNEQQYGVLMAMFGVGAICGALFTAGRRDDVNARGPLFIGGWLMVAGVLMVSCVRSYYGMMPGLLLAGFGGILFLSSGNTMVQLNVEDRIRGRVMGIWALGFGGSMPLGSFIAGSGAELLHSIDGESIAARLPQTGAWHSVGKLIESFTNGGAAFLTIGLMGAVMLVLNVLVFRVMGRGEQAVASGAVSLEKV